MSTTSQDSSRPESSAEPESPAPESTPEDSSHTASQAQQKPQLPAASAKRVNSTITGMLIATGVCLAFALLVPLLVPQISSETTRPPVDAAAIASQAAPVAGFTPVAPLPEGWKVNYARWNSPGTEGVGYWEIGYTTSAQKFVAFQQTQQANPTWIASQADSAPVTGDREVSGMNWTLRDKPQKASYLVGDFADGQTVIIRSERSNKTTGDFADADTLATAIITAKAGGNG